MAWIRLGARDEIGTRPTLPLTGPFVDLEAGGIGSASNPGSFFLPGSTLCLSGPAAPKGGRRAANMAFPPFAWERSGDDLRHDLPLHVRQAHLAAGVAVRQLLVIEAELVEDRRVPVVDVHRPVDHLVAVFVGEAVGQSPL